MNTSTENPIWPEQDWDKVVDRVAQSVFRIETECSTGTGFAFSVSRNLHDGKHYSMLVTAWHVLEKSIGGSAPLKLRNIDGTKEWDSISSKIGYEQIGDNSFDTAVLLVGSDSPLIQLSDLLPILPFESQMARGAEIGWLGFPGVANSELCFFKGVVSGYLNQPPTYLIDGVAINGVSGGPVFDNRCHLIGMMTAYIPNKLDEHTILPGLAAVTPINAIRLWAEQNLGASIISKPA